MAGRADVSLGATANVSYQRKRTISEIIPPDVTRAKAGKWLDLISPITEWAGLKGDALRYKRQQLRVQQEAVLERLAGTIQSKMKNQEVVYPLPPKILVPALEAASLEEVNSPLVDWWAELLVSGATRQPIRPFIVDLMSKIGIEEAILLERLWNQFSFEGFRLKDKGRVVGSYFSGLLDGVIDSALENQRLATKDEKLFAIGSKFISKCEAMGVGARVSVPCTDGRQFYALPIMEAGAALDVCRSLNILELHTETVVIFADQKIDAQILFFSELGVEFMRACKPVNK